jgi:hypothetical protein
VKLLSALAALALCACTVKAAPSDAGWDAVAVHVRPAAIAEKAGVGAQFGPLTFRGGVELSSQNALFGGWSGLVVDASNRLTAISDEATFLRAQLQLNEAGDLVGLSEAKLALMRNEQGDPLDGKEWQDAEDIAHLADGRYAVSFERRHRILIYDLDAKGPIAPGTPGPAVPQNINLNEGLEALEQMANGDLIAGREFSARQKPPTQFYELSMSGAPLVSGDADVGSNFGLVALRRFSNGDYLGLERFYFPFIGHRIELRRFPAVELTATPPRLSGAPLVRLAKPLAMDNFEGLAVVETPGKPIRLYLMSDDNFSKKQRTLIYAFDLAN